MFISKMSKLLPQGRYGYANEELHKINPFSMINTLDSTANGYPWLSFGRRRKKVAKKKHVGYTRKKSRVVKVYKIIGMVGKRFYDKKKVPKGTRVYKRKSDVPKKKTKKRSSRKKRDVYYIYDDDGYTPNRPGYMRGAGCSRRRNLGECSSNPNCSWNGYSCRKKSWGDRYEGPFNEHGFGSGRSIDPAVGTNYWFHKTAANAAMPSLNRMEALSGFNNNDYVGSSQFRTFNSRQALNGMGW